jgi:hypothetical protein
MVDEEEGKDHGHEEAGESQEPKPQSRAPMLHVTPEPNAQHQGDKPQDREDTPQQETHNSLKSWIRRVRDFLNANAGAVSAAATVVIAVTTTCYTCIAFLQWRVVNRQLGVMEAADRPYVGVLAITTVVDPNTHAALVTAALKNFGKKPAVEFWASWEFFINGVKLVGTNAKGPKNRFSFFPGADQAMQATFRPEKWNRISSGQDALMIRVYLAYQSPGGERQYAECEERQYSPQNNMFMTVGECNPTPEPN